MPCRSPVLTDSDAATGVALTRTALFTRQFTLTTSTVGSGNVTLDPAGGVYDSSTVVTLTATPDSGYVFAGWSGDLSGLANPDSMVMDSNKTVTATFTEQPTQFALTTDVVGFGSVTLDPPGGVYDSSTVVTLTAVPDSGYVFAGWSGDLNGNANPDSVLMDTTKSVTAIFTRQFNLITNVTGFGSVTLDPAGGIYDSSTVVRLTATPDSGYIFAGWSGDLSGNANPDNAPTITMTTITSRSVKPFVFLKQYSLPVKYKKPFRTTIISVLHSYIWDLPSNEFQDPQCHN